MITIVFLCIMLGPHIIAGQRSVGPATHLTLLLFSISIVTASLSAIALYTQPVVQPTQGFPEYFAHLNPLASATIGLALLTPLYWAVEHVSPDADLRVDAVLAQTLALTFSAAILGGTPYLIELAALALTFVLFTLGIRNLRAPYLLK